jgi:hypothetical protein
VLSAIECQLDQSFIDHRESDCRTLQVECRFRDYRFTSQQWFRHSSRELRCPLVMLVIGIRKCHQEPRVSNSLQDRENPLRLERSRTPRTEPASLINEGSLPPSRAFSSCSRTMRPFGTPDCLDACSSQSASSLVSRIVIVLLIWRKCNTGAKTVSRQFPEGCPNRAMRTAGRRPGGAGIQVKKAGA